jgi:hypothetical protein
MELIAKADPGRMIEKITKLYKLKDIIIVSGDNRNIREHARITVSCPNLLHSFVAEISDKIIGMTEMRRIVELVN